MWTWYEEFRKDPALAAMGLVPVPDGARSNAALSWRTAWLAIGGGIVILFGVFWPTVAHTVSTWIDSATFNHGFLILPICGYLFWTKRGIVASMVPTPNYWGLAFMVGAGFLWLLGNAASVVVVQQFALVGMVYALFLAVLGLRIVWALVFPLFYLIFAVPFGEFLVPRLQDVTAVFVVRGLRLLEIPVFLDGIFLSIPTGNFEVAEACSGVRFLIATIALGFLFAHITYTSWIRRVVFVLLSFIVPVIANGFRAFGIVYIAYLSNNELAVGVDHIVYGWVFFALVTLILLSLGMTFRDAPMENTQLDSVALSRVAAGGMAPRRVAAIAGAALVAALVMPGYAALIDMKSAPARPAALTAPAIGGGWSKVAANGQPDWTPIFAGADRTMLQGYVKNGKRVDLFLAYYTHERQGAELISNDNRLADTKRWARASSWATHVRVDGGDVSAMVTRMRDRNHGRLVLYWYWINGRFTANAYLAKALQALDRLAGGSPTAAVVLSATYDDQPSEAEALLKDFLSGAGPFEPALRAAAR